MISSVRLAAAIALNHTHKSVAFVCGDAGRLRELNKALLKELQDFPTWYVPGFELKTQGQIRLRNKNVFLFVRKPEHLKGRTLNFVFVNAALYDETRALVCMPDVQFFEMLS